MKKLLLALLLVPFPVQAAITFVDDTTAQSSSGTSLTPSEPTGTAQNDLIIAFCAVNSTGGTWTDPADFTEIDQEDTSPAFAWTTYVGYKIRGATAGSGYNFSVSSSAAQIACTLLAFRGASTSSPFDVAFSSSYYVEHNNSVTGAGNPITTVTDGAWVLLLQHWNGGVTGFSLAPPSGYTSRSEILQASRVNFAVTKEVASAGTETPGVFQTTGSATTQDSSVYTLALKPDSAAAPTFTAGPALGTATQTTLPTTFTTDQDGTVEGVACANGLAAPSVAQVFDDKCGDGNAAAASFDEAVTSGVADGETFTGLTAGTTYDLYFAIDGDDSDSVSVSTLADQTTVAVPVFTVGPAVGTLTDSSAQITGTSSQSGTWYGIACADGETANVSQVKAGTTCSGGAAAAAFNKSVTGADSQTFTGLSDSTTYDTFHVISNAAGDSASIPLANVTTQASGDPTFTDGPSVAAAADGYTVSGTISCTGTCTVYAVACSPGDAAPAASEIEAGQCGGGNDAILEASEVWTSTSADNFSLTGSNKPPRLSVYVSGSDGSNATAVVPFLNSDRTARSGYALVAMSSHASDGLCNLDSYFDLDCADGDVFEYESAVNGKSNCVVNIATDGRLSFYDHTDGQNTGPGESGDSTDDGIDDCAGQLSFEISYEDASSATDGLFTAPTVGNFATDDTIYVNNTAPVCEPEPALQKVLDLDEAMTSVDLETFGNCEDEDGDALSYSITSGTLPSGTSLGGTGDRTWSGTPDTKDEEGEAITVTVTDPAGDSTTYDFTAFVVDPVGAFTMPDCDSLTASECEDLVVEAAPWREEDPGLIVGGFVCGTGQPFLTIADTDPDAGVATEPFAAITVYLVGAVIPDLTGMTAADAIAAIEALCP